MNLMRVTMPGRQPFCAGVVYGEGWILRCAPILRRSAELVGFEVREFDRYWRAKGAKAERTEVRGDE